MKVLLTLLALLLPIMANANVAFNPPHESTAEAPALADPIITPMQKAEDEAEEDIRRKAEEAQASYRRKIDIARSEANVEINACKTKYLEGKLKSHAQMVTCFNTKVMSYFLAAGYPYPDLLRELGDKRVQMARLIDKKIYSEQQAEQELADFEKAMADEEVKRREKSMVRK